MTQLATARRPGPAAEVGSADYRALRDFLYARSGLYFSEGKRFLLENRLLRRMEVLGVPSPREYLALVSSPSRGVGELVQLLDAVTTHETFFFRNHPQMEAFRRQVLPEILKQQSGRGRKSLRIWSAACSSGEEPFSLAMLILEELGDRIGEWDIQVTGTDIATSMIRKAEEALYHKYSFRGAPAYFIQKYFEPDGTDMFRLKDAPRRLVDFRILNFMDQAGMRAMGGFHIVFCRNALIYFDKEAKQRFVAHFERALEPEGYLFIGHSESLHGVTDAFKLIHFLGSLGYKKPAAAGSGSVRTWNRTA